MLMLLLSLKETDLAYRQLCYGGWLDTLVRCEMCISYELLVHIIGLALESGFGRCLGLTGFSFGIRNMKNVFTVTLRFFSR